MNDLYWPPHFGIEFIRLKNGYTRANLGQCDWVQFDYLDHLIEEIAIIVTSRPGPLNQDQIGFLLACIRRWELDIDFIVTIPDPPTDIVEAVIRRHVAKYASSVSTKTISQYCSLFHTEPDDSIVVLEHNDEQGWSVCDMSKESTSTGEDDYESGIVFVARPSTYIGDGEPGDMDQRRRPEPPRGGSGVQKPRSASQLGRYT